RTVRLRVVGVNGQVPQAPHPDDGAAIRSNMPNIRPFAPGHRSGTDRKKRRTTRTAKPAKPPGPKRAVVIIDHEQRMRDFLAQIEEVLDVTGIACLDRVEVYRPT
ncbi:hypothetical protein ACWFRP_45645, partial [Streptomyces sp. NPDC055134]